VLSLSEIFCSLSGEGKYSGYPCTFIRLAKCNLSCSYCDTKYANEGKKQKISIEKVINTVVSLSPKYICITGGEPLLQSDVYPLIYELTGLGYTVFIETNGSVVIEKDNYVRSFSYVMDIKCPSSNMSRYNKYENLANLQAKDEVKFVIGDYSDYMFALSILKHYPTPAQIIFSPIFIDGKSTAHELAEWIIADNLTNVRLGLQLHKIIDIK
jgi:7-carboxy-7-deazaguanine synthase